MTQKQGGINKRSKFLPIIARSSWDYDTYDWDCNRLDKRNLIQEWKGNHTGGKYVENKQELMDLTGSEDSVLGIFSNSYVYWDNEVNETNNIPRYVKIFLD